MHTFVLFKRYLVSTSVWGPREEVLLWLGKLLGAPDCISLLHTSPDGEMNGRSVVLSVPINEM